MFDKMLKELQDKCRVIQTKPNWTAHIPQDIWNQYFAPEFTAGRAERVGDFNLDYQKRLISGLSVVKIYDRYLGVDYVIRDLQQGMKSLFYTLDFFEVEPVTVRTYKKKVPRYNVLYSVLSKNVDPKAVEYSNSEKHLGTFACEEGADLNEAALKAIERKYAFFVKNGREYRFTIHEILAQV